MKEIAWHIHEVRVVVGTDGLKTLLPAGLLNDGNGKRDDTGKSPTRDVK